MVELSRVKRHSGRSAKGFTLVEIMVAIAILGLVGVTLVTSANRSTRDLTLMRDKIEALSIAEYTLNSVLIHTDMPELGRNEDIIERSGRRWLVEASVSETLNEKVLRIDVLVKSYEDLGDSEDRSVILLSGFKTDLLP